MSRSEPSLAHLLRGLPEEIRNKINKTKQTRGAQPPDRVIYQNRVNRNGLAVVPYRFRNQLHPDGFENGYVIMIRPEEYFSDPGTVRRDFDQSVVVGNNAFVYYDNRAAYREFPPLNDWRPRKRGGPGEVVFRMPATTSTGADGQAKVEGEAQGIRFFEYASSQQIFRTCVQLAFLAWHTDGINEVASRENSFHDLKRYVDRMGLWDIGRLENIDVLDNHVAICPLCRKRLQASELMSRIEQAEGREVTDLQRPQAW